MNSEQFIELNTSQKRFILIQVTKFFKAPNYKFLCMDPKPPYFARSRSRPKKKPEPESTAGPRTSGATQKHWEN